MSTILMEILEARLTRLMTERATTPLIALEQKARGRSPARDFAAAFRAPGTHIIAELKAASPSKGVLREQLDAGELAASYEEGGAAAISVLTEQDYFRGSLAALEAARDRVRLPVLRKDFITDPYQIVEARAAGADSFLLIASILDPGLLASLIEAGRAWDMEPLVEVHDRGELNMALEAGARVIGINNRNLKTFQVDINTTLNLVQHVPDDRIIISESGISDYDQIVLLSLAGVHGFLIGESLVTSSDPVRRLRGLIHGT